MGKHQADKIWIHNSPSSFSAVTEAIGIKNIIGAHSNGCILEGTAQAIGLPLIPSFVPGTNASFIPFFCFKSHRIILSCLLRLYLERLAEVPKYV